MKFCAFRTGRTNEKESIERGAKIIGILGEVHGGGSACAVCPAYGISQSTYYAWKRSHGGMDVSEGRRLA